MELQRKTVQMANMERTKIVVKGIVQKSVVYCEVIWLLLAACTASRCWAVNSSLRPLARRAWRDIRIGKRGVLVWGFKVRGEV